jgi:hypothetical protein
MAKEKRISELPGITQAAVVGLNRAGIVTIHDLLKEEFDRVAYVVDDYNEAARLVKEARKIAEGRRGVKHGPDPLVPGPLSNNPQPNASRHHARSGSISHSSPAPTPAPSQAHPPAAAHAAPHSSEASAADGDGLLAGALPLAMRGIILTGDEAEEGRTALARRLEAVALLLSHGGSEQEMAAALLLEAAEAGAIGPEDAADCAPNLEQLLEECGSLRAVPMLPTGKPPRYYLEMAKTASREARRVCATHLILAVKTGEPLPGGPWYAKLLLESLEAGGPDELVALARTAVDRSHRAAA